MQRYIPFYHSDMYITKYIVQSVYIAGIWNITNLLPYFYCFLFTVMSHKFIWCWSINLFFQTSFLNQNQISKRYHFIYINQRELIWIKFHYIYKPNVVEFWWCKQCSRIRNQRQSEHYLWWRINTEKNLWLD